MHRRTWSLFVVSGLIATLLLALTPAVAEKPLSSPAQLREQATHIVLGTVERVHPRVRRHGDWEHVEYLAEVTVAAVEKGEDLPLDRPLYVRYWTKAWKGKGAPTATGSGGHAPLPKEGTAARLYLARNAYDGFGTERHDGGYHILGVNGTQPLTAEEMKRAADAAAPKEAPSFPMSWRGVWQGTLKITPPGGKQAETRMFIAIRPTDDPKRWEFRLGYGQQPQRKYELVVRDAAKGRYAIDEKNGIVLPATYADGELFSYFSLNGSILLARYRLVGDFLHFDLTQTRLAPDVKTGGQGTPEVGGHDVRVVQRAVLRR
ncbi:MAG: hypothetical protein QNJ90_06110 [Planctomycetota bacterium]|nr:hypothetical protein [Planctomycetota bacterium]